MTNKQLSKGIIWFKEYKWILTSIGMTIAFITSLMLGTDGIVWKKEESNLAQQEFELKRLKESIFLRDKRTDYLQIFSHVRPR